MRKREGKRMILRTSVRQGGLMGLLLVATGCALLESAERASPAAVPRQVVSDAWRIYPKGDPSSMMIARDASGRFERLSPNRYYNPDREKAWQVAERIAADQMFMVTHRGNTYNLWALLEIFEPRFGADDVPHLLCSLPKTIDYVDAQYGKADYVGKYFYPYEVGGPDEFKEGTHAVHWYGPIFLMVSSGDQVVTVGGWPSRLGLKGPPSGAGGF